MKVLKTVMLSLLAVTCAVAVTIAVFHFAGGERDTDGRDRTRSRSVVNDGENDEPEDAVTAEGYVEAERADYRFLHRGASKSVESGLWQFFPSIPYFEVLPGETAVLSVSVTGFVGWEVDSAYANVELFDEKTDDENAYVSFIMPDEEVSIAALYTDEIPQINFENQMELILSRRYNHEHGAAPVASSEIQPFPVEPTPIYWIVNNPMNLTIRNPAVVSDVLGLRPQDALWIFPPTYPNSPAINRLPEGLTWRNAGVQGGILITGTPTVVGVTNFYFDLYDGTIYDELNPDASFIGMYEFVFTVVVEPPPPRIITPSVPDAMVGVRYEVTIQTSNFPFNLAPPFSVWQLVPDDARELPAGLDLFWDEQGDMSQGWIRGTPELAGPEVFTFTITVQQTNPATNLGITTVVGPTPPLPAYSIRVWDRPELSYIQKDVSLSGALEPAPAPGPHAFLDGMVGVQYGHGAAIVADVIPGLIGTWEYRIVPNTAISGLPTTSGLFLNAATGLVTGASPALPAAPHDPTAPFTYTFDVVFTATNTDIIVGRSETVRFTIRIWPQPEFVAPSEFVGPSGVIEPYRLRPGMDHRPLNPPEPVDRPYEADIIAKGLDIDASTPITWSWRVVNPGNLPPNTAFSMRDGNGFISGMIQNTTGAAGSVASRDFSFSIEIEASSPLNPNIDEMKITQEFNIWVWNRRYLYIEPLAGATDRFVRRVPAPGEPFEVDWEPDIWGEPGTVADQYRLRRAVMPGTYGQIRVPNTPTNFTRWEVMTTPAGSAGEHTSIADNWGFSANNALSYVQILMPSFNAGVAVDGDVYIAGFAATHPNQPQPGRPNGLWTIGENTGTVGNVNSSGFVRFDGELGGGGRPVSWDDYTIPNLLDPLRQFPPGMDFTRISVGIPTTLILSIPPGGPTQEGVFTFTLGLNLPGSMRIQRDFTYTVGPALGVIVGNADPRGGDAVNLADVIMLGRFRNGDLTAAELAIFDADAANIRNIGLEPTNADLTLLVRWFSNPDVTSDLQYPIGTARPRNPNR